MADVQTLILAAITGGFVLFGVTLFGVALWSKGGADATKAGHDRHRAF